MRINLWWIRRDLRLADNRALQAALAAGEAIVPVFILDPLLLSSQNVGEKRMAFLLGGLRQLDRALRRCGSYLVVREGQPAEQLAALCRELQADGITAEEDYSPYARRRDAHVGRSLPLTLVEGVTVVHPEMIEKADGTPYTVYTPFSRRWKELPAPHPESLPAPPASIPTPPDVRGVPLPDRPRPPEPAPFPPGEQEAQRRLEAFVRGDGAAPITHYADRRNRLDLAGTSGLSPYLRFGMISARQAVVSAQRV